MHLGLDGNFFHMGWLARFLSLPRKHPSAGALKPGDVAAFEDGWDTCDETPTLGMPNRYHAFEGTLLAGRLEAFWYDDDGNPLEDFR